MNIKKLKHSLKCTCIITLILTILILITKNILFLACCYVSTLIAFQSVICVIYGIFHRETPSRVIGEFFSGGGVFDFMLTDGDYIFYFPLSSLLTMIIVEVIMHFDIITFSAYDHGFETFSIIVYVIYLPCSFCPVFKLRKGDKLLLLCEKYLSEYQPFINEKCYKKLCSMISEDIKKNWSARYRNPFDYSHYGMYLMYNKFDNQADFELAAHDEIRDSAYDRLYHHPQTSMSAEYYLKLYAQCLEWYVKNEHITNDEATNKITKLKSEIIFK